MNRPLSLIRGLLLFMLAAMAAEQTQAADNPARIYPDDAYSRPTQDRRDTFASLDQVHYLGLDALTLNKCFAVNELDLIQHGGKSWTQWRFNLKPGQQAPTGLSLFGKDLRRAPRRIVMEIANLSAQPLELALMMNELAWASQAASDAKSWLIQIPETLPAGQSRRVSFELAKAICTNAAEGAAMRFPVGADLVIGNPKPGAEYRILLRDLVVEYPDATGLAGASLKLPERIKAGQTMAIEIAAQGALTGRKLDVELRLDEQHVLWRTRLTAPELAELARAGRCRIERRAPAHIASGPVCAGLVADGYRVAGTDARSEMVNTRKPELPKAERRLHNGRPTMFVNGRPGIWSGYASYDWQPGPVNEFGAAGANMFFIPTTAGAHVHSVCGPTWIGPDTFDFRELEEQVGIALGANPEAMLIIRVSLNAPAWWLKQHPEEQARVRTTAGDIPWRETGNPAASLASLAWRREQDRALARLIEYIQGRPWASNVVSFFPTGAVTEEWFAWACNDQFCADYSRPNQEAFRRWCAQRQLPFTEIPPPEARDKKGFDFYQADPSGQWAAAYAEYSSEMTAEAIGHYAAMIKQLTGGKSLVGTYYGYTVQLAGEPRQNMAGHNDLVRVLGDPNIDYLAGIPLHNFRTLKGGYSAYISATESILAHGKLYLNDSDLFSWLHPLVWHKVYDPADPRAAAIKMHRRELANDMVHGAPLDWFSLMSSWHHDEALLKDFAEQIKLQNTSPQYDRSPAEEIAFVIDDMTMNWCMPSSTLLAQTTPNTLHTLAMTGAPVGVWLLADVDKLPERIKLVVVSSAYAPRPQDLKKLEALIARGGRTVVLVGPVGLIDPSRRQWRPEATASLTGLPLELIDAPTSVSIFSRDSRELLAQQPVMWPYMISKTPGFLEYRDGRAAGGERALAGGGRLIWCALAPVKPALFRQWAEAAGVHCHAPLGCFVHASRDLVAITASEAGPLSIRWAKDVAVKDLFDGWQGQGAAMECPFEAGQTRLFHVKPR